MRQYANSLAKVFAASVALCSIVSITLAQTVLPHEHRARDR
ncbi:hypothetical protein [Paraburkholderia sediminicola]